MVYRHESATGSKDLNVVYRPYKLEDLLGNESNKRIIAKGLDNQTLPHTMLFTGPAGCGKTTTARIIAAGLNCESSDRSTSTPCLKCSSCRSIIDYNSVDVLEINVGKTGGKGDVERIVDDLPTAPFRSRNKVLIFDEAHKLTPAAQDLLLKPIEDGFSHVYYIFCTNHPEKLRTRKNKEEGEAFLDRCYAMHFGPISSDDVYALIEGVCIWEGVSYSEEVLHFLADESAGIPRKALRWLRQVIDDGVWKLPEAKHIVGVLVDEEDPQIIELCRSLIRGKFKEAVGMYNKVRNNGAESIRISIALYFLACLKGARTVSEGDKFSEILDVLLMPIYESGKVGDMAMINRIYKVTRIINTRKK